MGLSKYRVTLVASVCIAIALFIIGIVIGYFIPNNKSEEISKESITERNTKFREKLKNYMKTENLEENVKFYSKRPHIAGSQQNYEYALNMKQKWESYGFQVEMPEYEVLLSYPREDKPNVVELQNNKGQAEFTVQGREKILDPSENDTLVIPPFLAYSAQGNVKGELVYVNYGRIEDFKELEQLGVSVNGKIAIMRYGKIFRGSKVRIAEKYGAVGALIYNDPADYAPEGVDNTYPDSWWLPDSGVQRGSILRVPGDPLTPLLPSIPGIYKEKVVHSNLDLPQIPCHPLSYGDAVHFLQKMGGNEVPKKWQGGLPGLTYRLGGKMNNNYKVNMQISTELSIKKIYNVIGTMKGKEEPDRIVLFGNHRDSWVFGAVDAVTATAITMEVARGLGQMYKEGWRPRRTIMLCSWGAEEYGLMGSEEWVEENYKLMQDQAVVYLNSDIAVNGNWTFYAASTPLLRDVILETMSEIDDPNSVGNIKTLYDRMAISMPSQTEPGKPEMITLGSGSDFHAFYQFVGVPSADWGYWWGQKGKSFEYTGYPVYHSVHETILWLKKFVDPDFKISQAVAKFASSLLLKCTDSAILPMNVIYYSTVLNRSYKDLLVKLKEIGYSTKLITNLGEAVKKFESAATKFQGKVKAAKETDNFLELRILNDKLTQLERAFLYSYGLPGRPFLRHVVFAPSMHDMYGSSVFPGIGDALFEAQTSKDWAKVDRQISVVYYCIHTAIKLLTF